jgi:bifunctional UDP-N-acetylglucosamine pyrophosphorylase / glucosamine-1-phosphate N-acetyltransferase
MSQVAAVILAAGQGKRMRSATPKPLHLLAGKPIVGYVVDAARAGGVDRVVVVVGHGGDQVARALGDEVETVTQPELLGTGDAVRRAAPLLEAKGATSDVVVAYGDCPLLTSPLFASLIAHRRATGATIALVASPVDDPHGYGRVVRNPDGRVRAVVEEAAATEDERAIREINAGVYCFDAAWLWSALEKISPAATGEYYLTDLVGLATSQGKLVRSIEAPADVTSGVNDRAQLAAATELIRDRIRRRAMLCGVTLLDPATTYLDDGVEIGADTVIYPGTIVEGQTVIGANCRIGPHSHLVDARIGQNVQVTMSVVERAEVADNARVGPFSHLRPGARLGEGVELGNYAEVKNAVLGARTKMHHFSYVGDAEIGANVNVGAGTVTCNYDRETGQKSRTIVEAEVSLGSDTMLVAPVRIGARAVTGAGAVVTRDVAPDDVVLGVPARPIRSRRPAAK